LSLVKLIGLSESLKEDDFLYQYQTHRVEPNIKQHGTDFMQGLKRRVVYITLYEGIAILVASAGLVLMAGQSAGHSGVAAVLASAIAILWNLIFNALFEHWEARQVVRGRSLRRRIAHAIGFEGGLVAFLVPVFAWWLEVSLWQALVMDLGLVVFFLGYTFVFNWAFDGVFGLPASASGAAQPA
jgi:uncharacterized membrane protein